MGYTTDFSGSVEVSPALSQEEQEFLWRFADTRHCQRKEGLYYLRKDEEDINSGGTVTNGNDPEQGAPGLWCQWVPTDDGTGIEWDGGENFYSAEQWLSFLIEHFLKPNCRAKQADPERFAFLQEHTCNGEIFASGEDSEDHWRITVMDNVVYVHRAHIHCKVQV